jgi:DNA-directed RNA polymerase subunit N (RpoN/RPB10)
MSCGKPIAHLWEDFQERKKKESMKKILDSFKLERCCCRAALMGHVDLIDIAARFRKA